MLKMMKRTLVATASFLGLTLLAPGAEACSQAVVHLREIDTTSSPELKVGGRRATLVLQCQGGQASLPEATSLHLAWEAEGKTCIQTWQSCGNVEQWQVYFKVGATWSLNPFGDIKWLKPAVPGADISVAVGVDWKDLSNRCLPTRTPAICL